MNRSRFISGETEPRVCRDFFEPGTKWIVKNGIKCPYLHKELTIRGGGEWVWGSKSFKIGDGEIFVFAGRDESGNGEYIPTSYLISEMDKYYEPI